MNCPNLQLSLLVGAQHKYLDWGRCIFRTLTCPLTLVLSFAPSLYPSSCCLIVFIRCGFPRPTRQALNGRELGKTLL